MTTQTIYLSKKGIKELKKEVAKLTRDEHAVQQALKDLDKGDSRDERLARSERLSQLEALQSELFDKQYMLSKAKQLPRKRDALRVALGSVVDLIDTNGHLIRYTIVDTIEANPSDGRISMSSPLGQSLLGRQIKDVVQWGNGLRSNHAQLIAIR